MHKKVNFFKIKFFIKTQTLKENQKYKNAKLI